MVWGKKEKPGTRIRNYDHDHDEFSEEEELG